MYDKVQALKAQNPALKVLIAVGGWNMGPGPFSDMANNAASRANFVSTTVKFLQDNHFDGLDMDWVFKFDILAFLY
jgi:chitinase